MVKNRLSCLLGEHAMKQAELSRMTGIRPNTISSLYNNTSMSVKFEHIDRICEALECSPSELLIYSPNNVPKTQKLQVCKTQRKKKS